MPDVEKVIREFEQCLDDSVAAVVPADTVRDAIALLKAQAPITGETSDGYHTFNELYHHRAVLFSVIVANYKDRAWKSVRHYDGTMYDGMFIVGIDTPDGQATYHYDIEPYWDMFDCKVREFAPEWDGHTPAQAIERIGKLKAQKSVVMAGAELSDAELIEEIRKAPIALMPNVDTVPVVRCAYCKHCYDLSSDPMEPYDGESEWYCARFDRDTSAYEIDPYRFFCADGERRDDDALSGR